MIQVGEREYATAAGAIYGLLGDSAEFISQLRPGDYLLPEYSFDLLPRLERERALTTLGAKGRQGTTVLLPSHDEALLERVADEIWWVRGCEVLERGAPSVVLAAYRKEVARKLREEMAGASVAFSPSMRRGDGRASIEKVELLSENGVPGAMWQSGENVTVRVSVQFAHTVADPVIGILIRTRIGLNVYGTNTELENLHFGPVPAHHAVRIQFRFRCELCPGEYTLTVASHDPDGTWHDWLEEAVSFTVTDTRYTAGVANLRAKVEVIPEALAKNI